MSGKAEQQQVGGFAFTAQAKVSRKRPAQDLSSNASEKRRATLGDENLPVSKPLSTPSQAIVVATEYELACLEAYRSTTAAPPTERVIAIVTAAVNAANTQAASIDTGLAQQVASLHNDFVAHLSSELQKETASQQKSSLRNPKNVLNSKLKEDCLRRIKEFEQEKSHWEGLHTKLPAASASSSSSGPTKASPGTAVREWATNRAKHGAQLSAVPGAASRALQDLDVVADAMRKGSKAVKRAKKAVVAASKEARADAFESVAGKGGVAKDAKSIIRAMLR